MLRRGSAGETGAYMRRGLEPMARRLGLDMELAFFAAPTTPEARVLDAYRCGQSLLMSFIYPEAWPIAKGHEGRSARLARKAAKVVRRSLVTERGASAVSHMTQAYANEMAESWRRAAESGGTACDPGQLRESAVRSDALGELAAQHWPVTDPFGASDLIALSESQRAVDIDNPHALIDLHGYYGRARSACGAAALALGPDLQRYAAFIYAPVAFLELEFAAGLQRDWNFQAAIWQNLLSEDPRPYIEFMRSQ
jgi:hypothetical protein